MGILDIFQPRETPTPGEIIELAVFSLGSEFDLFRLTAHLETVFGNPAWERFGRRRSVTFTLDEGKLAEEIPYILSVRLFEDGGGFVRLKLDLAHHNFDIDTGPLWHRRELSAALARFLEAALSTRNPEALKHSAGGGETLKRLGIVPECIAGELDFGFSEGTTIIKIGITPKKGVKLSSDPVIMLDKGVYHLRKESAGAISEIERWVYREGAATWHRLSLRRWLERMEDAANSCGEGHVKDFSNFLRRVNHFILRERRFTSAYLPAAMLEAGSSFSMLAADFNITSSRLLEILAVRRQDRIEATIAELNRQSVRQERLFAVGFASLVLGAVSMGLLKLFFPGLSWLWFIVAGVAVLLPVAGFFLYRTLSTGDEPRRKARVAELSERHLTLENLLDKIEHHQGVPDEFHDELKTRMHRELARVKRLQEEELEEEREK